LTVYCKNVTCMKHFTRYGHYTGEVEDIIIGRLAVISKTVVPTRGQSNLTKSASRGAHSPVRGHPRGSKVVPLNSWGRVSY